LSEEIRLKVHQFNIDPEHQITSIEELDKKVTKKKSTKKKTTKATKKTTKKKTAKKATKKTTKKASKKADVAEELVVPMVEVPRFEKKTIPSIIDIETKDPEELLKEEPEAPPTPVVIPEIKDRRDLVNERYFEGDLDIDVTNYLPASLELNTEELHYVKKSMRHMRTGVGRTVPVKCSGNKCPFKDQCPFFKIGRLPENEPCPVESLLMDLYTKRYLDEFDVRAEDMSEITMMQMLAATHIIEMRAFAVLGSGEHGSPDGLVKNVMGFTQDDKPIMQLMEHPAYNQLERAWRWRKSILESMVGTRKERYKKDAALKEKSGVSLSMTAADLKSKIDKLSVIDISPN